MLYCYQLQPSLTVHTDTDAFIACCYLIANHNHSWLITNINVWSIKWADHELIWWTKWHEYFFIMSVINKHQTAYLYDLKMRDSHYRYVTYSIFRHSRLSKILSCDKPCRINGLSKKVGSKQRTSGAYLPKICITNDTKNLIHCSFPFQTDKWLWKRLKRNTKTNK